MAGNTALATKGYIDTQIPALCFLKTEYADRYKSNVYSITDNYTIQTTDQYTGIDFAHSLSTKLIEATLPDVAANIGKKFRFQNGGTHSGLSYVNGDGTNILFRNKVIANFKLLSRGDYVEVRSNGTYWIIEHCYSSIETNEVNNSDWEGRNISAGFDYDTKSNAVSWTGEHIVISDGGSLQKAVVIYDSGGAGASGTMYVASITDSATSLGVWTNNQTVTATSTSETCLVDEISGSSKNQGMRVYHIWDGLDIQDIERHFICSSDETNATAQEIITAQRLTGAYEGMSWSVDSSASLTLFTGVDGHMWYTGVTFASLDNENYYFNLKLVVSF